LTIPTEKFRRFLRHGRKNLTKSKTEMKTNSKKIIVDDVHISRDEQSVTVQVKFSVGEDLEQYIDSQILENKYFAVADGGVIPKSLAVVPFVCNVLPLVWLTDAELVLDELDNCFYESIPNIKKGYEDMYPQLCFKGHIVVKTNVVNDNFGQKSLCLFSGGVDSYATLFAHMSEKPLLLAVHGADVPLSDIAAWAIVEQGIIDTAKQFSLDYICCQSNFRTFVNEQNLNVLLSKIKCKEDWWHGFQHGIGLIGLVAPLSTVESIKTLYIASTFTIRERQIVTCASDPRIDNNVAFSGVDVVHDQFEYNRQEKIQKIVAFCANKGVHIKLHVCWVKRDGNNCCDCEKCWRTIYGLIVAGGNPYDYGFYVSDNQLKRIKRKIKYILVLSNITIPLWKDIQKAYIENNIDNNNIQWIRHYDFEKWNIWKRSSRDIRRKIRHVFGME